MTFHRRRKKLLVELERMSKKATVYVVRDGKGKMIACR